MSTVLVVDDKEMLRDSVAVTLQRVGFTVLAASGGEAALEMIARKRPDAIVTDLRMPGLSGTELIEKVREIDDDLPIVLMTAYGTVETAVEAMKLGAFDYITKPFEGDELVVAVKRAMEHARLRRENAVLRMASGEGAPTAGSGAPLESRRGLERLVGDSVPMRHVKEKVRAIANAQGTVLISGESGTGKEVVARAIHEESKRSDEPFLAVNCAAMSETLLESELFGHERGAFTGADKLRKGRFELAHRGTLLLDEISEIKPQLQAKLLRVLQERVFERVGSSTSIGVDVRVIATTNRGLGEEVTAGRFRQDLFYRLNVLPLGMPPLRERLEDVRTLAPHFVERTSMREGRRSVRFMPEALDLLASYKWHGNVRELHNLCERAVVLCENDVITPSLISGWLGGERVPVPVVSRGAANGMLASGAGVSAAERIGPEPRPLAEIEREVIVETLQRFNGHRQKTARALGIGVRTLGLKLKKWKEQRLVAETL